MVSVFEFSVKYNPCFSCKKGFLKSISVGEETALWEDLKSQAAAEPQYEAGLGYLKKAPFTCLV